MDIETISLRPLALKPGGGVNPFASFAKGAGANLKNRVSLNGSALHFHHLMSLTLSFPWPRLT